MFHDRWVNEVHPYSGIYTAISTHEYVIFGKLTHNQGSGYYIVDDVLFIEERALPGEEDTQKIVRQGPEQMVLERQNVTSITRSSKKYHATLTGLITE